MLIAGTKQAVASGDKAGMLVEKCDIEI